MDPTKGADIKREVEISVEQSPPQMTSTDLPPPLTEFTWFPKLPIELRLKIWGSASFEPRNVDIWIAGAVDGDDEPILGESFCHYVSTCPIPSVLQTSQESRVEALNHYMLDFDTTLKMQLDPSLGRRGNVTLTSEAQIYINWNVDRVCVMNLNLANSQSLEVLVNKCKKKNLDSLAVGLELGLVCWHKDRPRFDAYSESTQLATFIALKPWDIGLSELILFPYARHLGSAGFRFRTLRWTSQHILKDGETIQFKRIDPSETGIDRYAIRRLKLGKLELQDDIQLREAARTQEEMESSDTKQGKSTNTEAMEYPEINLCEAVLHKVKGREHWPINKRIFPNF